MKIEVYTKPNCPECVSIKTKLKNNDIDFEEIQISDGNMDMILKHTRSAPAVFIDGVFKSNDIAFNYIMSKTTKLDNIDI